jgi:hypothetical protein
MNFDILAFLVMIVPCVMYILLRADLAYHLLVYMPSEQTSPYPLLPSMRFICGPQGAACGHHESGGWL